MMSLLSPQVREKPIHELFRTWEIQDGFMMHFNRVFEFALEIELPATLFLSDSGHMTLAEMQTQLITIATPEGERTRIIHRALPTRNAVVDEYLSEVNTDEAQLRLLAYTRAETIRNFQKTDAVRDFRVFLTSTCSEFKKVGKHAIERSRLEEVFEALNEQRAIMCSTLNSFGIKYRILDDQGVFDLIWTFVNPHLNGCQPPKYKTPDKRLIPYSTAEMTEGMTHKPIITTTRSQLTTTHINGSAGTYLKIGDKFLTTLELRDLPDDSVLGNSNKLFTTKGQCYIITDIQRLKQMKMQRSIRSQAKLIIGNAKGSALKDGAANRAKAAADYISSGQAQAVAVGLSVVVIADTLEEMKEQKRHVYSAFSKMLNAKIDMDDADTVMRWRKAIPCNGLPLTNMLATYDETATNLIPTAGSWRGSEKPYVIAINRFGQIVKYDPYDKRAGGRHVLVLGKTGAGKSYGLQAIEVDILKIGSELIVLDYGGSYEQMIIEAGGETIVIDPERDSFNAFELEEGELKPSDTKVLWLKDFVVQLLEGEATAIQKAIISAGIEQTYANALQRRGDQEWLEPVLLEDFARQLITLQTMGNEPLIKEEKDIAKGISRLLQQYISGPLAQFLNRPTSVRLNAKAISFELEPLRENPTLKPIALMLITELITRRLNKNRGKDITIIFEEFGTMMENRQLVATAEMLFATCRKKGGRVVAVNQTITAFEHVASILANINHYIVFQIVPEQQLALQRQLQLPDAVIRSINGLTREPGEYSEAMIFFKQTDSTFTGDVIAIRVSRLEHWTYTSDKDEKETRRQAIEKHGNRHEALWQLAYPGTQRPYIPRRQE
jgi:hypothetical protein